MITSLIAKITNNPAVLGYVALACFAIGLTAGAVPAWKYQGARLDALQAKYTSFVAQTKAEGEAAQKDKIRIEAEHQTNLEVIRNEYNDKLPQVRNNAVRNYLATHTGMSVNKNTSGGSLSGSSGSTKGTNGASQEQGTALCEPDKSFIQDAADDASKIGSWQKWATLNKFPIK